MSRTYRKTDMYHLMEQNQLGETVEVFQPDLDGDCRVTAVEERCLSGRIFHLSVADA